MQKNKVLSEINMILEVFICEELLLIRGIPYHMKRNWMGRDGELDIYRTK